MQNAVYKVYALIRNLMIYKYFFLLYKLARSLLCI